MIQYLVYLRNKFVYESYRILAKLSKSKLPTDYSANFVVSIASYPKRDPLLPAVFQALSRQTVLPQKWILVLSEEDYPQGLPSHLKKLSSRGIEILWVKDNPYAVKKLIPTIQKYPKMDVVTFDDELIYGKTVIERLVDGRNKFPKSIIGHVGKELCKKKNQLGMFYRYKRHASLKTNPNQVYFLGGSGTYYPSQSLDERVTNTEVIHRIVPGRGSDIWFWAAAVAKGTKQVCLGSKPDLSLYFAIPGGDNIKPLDQPGQKAMENRFQMAIDYFGIREKLLRELPDASEINDSANQ